jgi:hypothetical protein
MEMGMCGRSWAQHAAPLLIVVCVLLGLDSGVHSKFLLGILFQLFPVIKNEIYFIVYS